MLPSRLLRRTLSAVPKRSLCTAESTGFATPLYTSTTPRIVVVGCGGAGGNAVNNMISRGLEGVDFVVCNTDAQHLGTCLTDNRVQMGSDITSGLGCGAKPHLGALAAESSISQIMDHIGDADMVFVTAGMGGGTGTGAAPVIANAAMEQGMLTVAVVTEPFRFEGKHRAALATEGLETLKDNCNTMIVIPNDNLFKLLQDQPNTSLMDAFRIADDVLLAGVKSITDLMVIPGLINLDFADVQSIMGNGPQNDKIGQMAMMGTGQASGDGRAAAAAEGALSNPLLGDLSVEDATGMLINITGGSDMTLFEVDEAAQFITNRLRDPDANIIFGSAFDDALDGSLKVSMVATLPTSAGDV